MTMKDHLPDTPPDELAELTAQAKAGDAEACGRLLRYYMLECDPRDTESALYWAAEGAKLGDANCMHFMGLFFLRGEGVEQSDTHAAECFALAAKAGHPRAAYMMAHLVLDGKGGVERDFLQALNFMKQAYDGGVVEDIPEMADLVLSILQEHATAENPEICFQYAWACYNALFCPLNYDRAAQCYRIAAETGHRSAQYELGLCYLEGKGVPRDSAQAEHWNRLAALQGYPLAEYEEGSFYAMGDGVPQDHAEAFKWFSLAAEHDHPGANAAVGTYYQHGNVVEQDAAKAVQFYERSMELGSPKGEYQLGCCYVHGTGVPQHLQKGMRMLLHAAAQGHAPAQQEAESVLESLKAAAEQGETAAQAELGLIYAEVLPEPQYDEAYRLLSAAAETGHPRALFGLGECLLNGRGTEPDPERGAELLARAASAGEPDALALYGLLMQQMADTQEMRDEGADLIRTAAEHGSEIAKEWLAEEEE